MAARGEPQDGIFGEQPLGRRKAAEPQPLVGMIERQLELSPSARVHPLYRFRRKPQTHLPEQLAPGEPEAVASPHPHEMFDRGALELGRCAAREVADAAVLTGALSLGHHSGRRLFAPVAHEPETYTNGGKGCGGGRVSTVSAALAASAAPAFNGAIDITQIHIRQPDLDAVPLGVASQRVE